MKRSARPGSWRHWTTFAGLSLVAACTPDGDGADGPPRMVLKEQLRIDGYAADLVPIAWLGVSPDGTIALLQGQDHAVRFFGPDGSDQGSVGREGEGPGEFMRVVRGGWLADTLWVSDTQTMRVTLISPDREVVRALPPITSVHPVTGGAVQLPTYRSAFPYALLPDGDQLVAALGATGELADRFEGSPLLRVTPGGEIEALVTFLPSRHGSVSVRSGSGVAAAPIPFHPDPSWAVDPEGATAGTLTVEIDGPEGGRFDVTVYDAAGGVGYTRTFPFEGVPIPERVIDSVFSARLEDTRRTRALWLALEAEARPLVPPVYAPTRSLLLGRGAMAWIELRATAEGHPWLVLDEGGEPVGEVVLPTHARLHTADATHLWATERDELGIEDVVRYRWR